MTRIEAVVCLVFVMLLSCTAAFADVPIGSGSWQSWTVAGLPTAQTPPSGPYWNGASSDGTDENVGYCLATTNCNGFAGGPGAIPYWGNSDGSADTSFYFQGAGLGTGAALELEIAGNASINEFGWYQEGVANPALHVIFNGPDTNGATTTFTPTADYGFWFSGNGTVYYTQSSLNAAGSDPGKQHFALFAAAPGSQTYWLGMEDLNFSESDLDYNDMIVKVTNVSTPEPTAITLLIVMLVPLFIGLAARRRLGLS